MRKICQKLLLLKFVLFFPFVFPFFSSVHLFSPFSAKNQGRKLGTSGGHTLHDHTLQTAIFYTFFHPLVPGFKWQPWCLWYTNGKVCGNLGLLFCSIVIVIGCTTLVEKEMATRSNTLAWRIPWTEEPGGLHGVAKSRTRLKRLSTHAHTTLESSAWFLCSTWILGLRLCLPFFSVKI